MGSPPLLLLGGSQWTLIWNDVDKLYIRGVVCSLWVCEKQSNAEGPQNFCVGIHFDWPFAFGINMIFGAHSKYQLGLFWRDMYMMTYIHGSMGMANIRSLWVIDLFFYLSSSPWCRRFVDLFSILPHFHDSKECLSCGGPVEDTIIQNVGGTDERHHNPIKIE